MLCESGEVDAFGDNFEDLISSGRADKNGGFRRSESYSQTSETSRHQNASKIIRTWISFIYWKFADICIIFYLSEYNIFKDLWYL